MTDLTGLHRNLIRQLTRLHLDRTSSPSNATWGRLLDVVSTTYTEKDDERFSLQQSIDVSAHEVSALHKELSRQALQDTLTGLPNRDALIRHLDQSLAACAADGEGLAVLFIDLDGFKQVNDSLGHAIGDELLVLASQRIRACMRPHDVVARLGSDEFVVVCPNVSDATIVPAIAARIGSQLAAPFPIGELEAIVSASIGLVTSADAKASAEELLGQADLAMYEAKSSGKARAIAFDHSMQLAVDSKFSVRNALGRAITGHELRVLYQPIVSLAHEQVIGVEALVRWERPGFGLLDPDLFIPIAEESSLVSAVDCWILQEACRRGAQWCKAGGMIAINLSARTLQQDDVVHALKQSLRRTGIPPSQITLEITETTLLAGIGATEHNLGRLRALGVKLSIDDFGTGHSSLSQLQQTDVDVLKIDQSFVSVMDQDAPSAAIVSAIITLGHAMGLTLVAEGVETPTQAALLRAQGCDAAQGWLFGQPLPAEAVDQAFGITFPALTLG
ncbi:MAG: EAL domain-containing protein [Actinomycetota bacterium]